MRRVQPALDGRFERLAVQVRHLRLGNFTNLGAGHLPDILAIRDRMVGIGLPLAMGVFCTALPIFAQSAAIRRLGSPRVALVSMLGPLATIGFAVWLLGEPLSLAQVAGALLVIGGIATISRRTRN